MDVGIRTTQKAGVEGSVGVDDVGTGYPYHCGMVTVF